jgi:hypothetical protein
MLCVLFLGSTDSILTKQSKAIMDRNFMRIEEEFLNVEIQEEY